MGRSVLENDEEWHDSDFTITFDMEISPQCPHSRVNVYTYSFSVSLDGNDFEYTVC